MASYERGINQPTLIVCLQEALAAALLMINIAQMNSSYGKNRIVVVGFFILIEICRCRFEINNTLVVIKRS